MEGTNARSISILPATQFESGNVARQPAFRDKPHRIAPGGLGNCDRVMESGLILPSNHGIDDEGIAYIGDTIEAFFN